jgi:hypothetical protein
MKKLLLILLGIGLLPLGQTYKGYGQCKSNMGFESGSFASWSTSTDSNFITPASRRYFNPGISPKVVSYGVTDMWLGTITRPNSTVGNYLTRVGNRGLRAVADTVYRTYIIDSLSDKLTIYSMGVSELAHNYWGVPTVEAPGFGYEIYVNGVKLDCLKGSFFCGNMDQPPVWQLGQFKDTSTVRKSTAWSKETLNFSCYEGDTVEVRLFTRDCILLGHYAYAYFDVVCGDTSKPVINKIMLNDIIQEDELTLYCKTSTTLSLEPNTEVCPIFRSNVQWSPANYITGAANLDSVKIYNVDSVWIFAEASFSNYCQTVDVRDSILVKYRSSDPHDNIPKMPRNFCDCKNDTLDFGTATVTSVKDQNGNFMTLDSGILLIKPCDNFYEESFWKQPSSRIVTRKSQIGTSSWSTGNTEGAIGIDSILATGKIRYTIDYKAGKAFFCGITTNNVNNNNDMPHSIYYNNGNIRAYYGTTNLSNLGTYSGTVDVEFVTLSNRRVQIWINGVLSYSYTNAQRATFPVFADFSARSNDTSHIRKTSIFGPTKNIKDFTRLLVPTTYKYFLEYTDRCGVQVHDTIKVIPGFNADLHTTDDEICGLDQVHMNVSSTSSIIEEIQSTSSGNGSLSGATNVAPGGTSTINYDPQFDDFGNSQTTVFLTARSGRCIDTDTATFVFHEIPTSNAGADISTTADSFVIGGTPAGQCTYCSNFTYDWNQGNALSDSTVANPMAFKANIGSPALILMVRDPVSGCFSRDTTYIYTSLDNQLMAMNTHCIAGNSIQADWVLIPTLDNYKFGLEYSIDYGETWIGGNEIYAGEVSGKGLVSKYTMTIKKPAQAGVMYRWYSANAHGDKMSVVVLDEPECGNGTTYNVHPNPFTNRIDLHIESASHLKSSYTIQVFNQYGQLVTEKEIDTRQGQSSQFYLDGLQDITKGIYYVHLKSNDNTLYSTMIVKTE